ncbi:MAG: HAMP domain-containing histidine kinase [Ruminococcus sp.]|nr:HAMP domain-containing histidine kinase [Ruminococcus sp.]
MKSKIRRKKRITFLRLFVSSVLLAFMASFAFAFGLREYIRVYIRTEAQSEASSNVSDTMSKINELNAEGENPLVHFNAYLSPYTHYCIDFTNFSSDYYPQLASNLTENCYAVSAIIDSDNNIVASNKEKLEAIIKLDDDEKARWFVCDREYFNIPQLDELFECYSETGNYEIILDSVYVNKSDYSFIPHKGRIEILKETDNELSDDSYLHEYENIGTKEINIEFNNENYELITLNQPPSNEAPRTFACGFYGIEKNILDDIMANVNVNISNANWSFGLFEKNYNGKNLLYIDSINPVYIDGKSYSLYTAFIVDDNADIVMKLYWKYVIIVSAVLLIAALLLSWRQNVINKARYAFEEYQKALINNLAHDLKTPMTAIGGYAENAKKYLEKGTSENIISFLDAITENVFYVDTIVNRTLELNHLNKIQEVKKESVQMHKIAETSIEKYNLILDEKHVTVELKGECELMADRTTIESAIENLISNAVKYTAENSRILITADKNSITITNDTTDNIDTKDLIMPFVKDDKSRNENSSGIGLAIVQSVANLNNLKFIISSSGNQFKAVLSK